MRDRTKQRASYRPLESSADRLRRMLADELRHPGYGEIQHLLWNAEPHLEGQSWSDIGRWVDGERWSTANDSVLSDLIERLAASGDPRISTVLFWLLFPQLTRLSRRRRAWIRDEGERWALVCEAFLQALWNLCASGRTEFIERKLINDANRRLYEEARRVWRSGEAMTSIEEIDPEDECLGAEDADLLAAEFAVAAQRVETRLQRSAARGLIAVTDADLLLGTRIYGENLRDAANRVGLSYECAKKRRQRAQRRFGYLTERRIR